MASRCSRHLSWFSVLLFFALAGGCVTGAIDHETPGEKDEARILERMAAQEAAWNAGDLDGFMEAYWKSDSLLFVGSRGPSRGWSTTLANYRSAYPDRNAMGTLSFGVEELSFAGQEHALMLGSWRLDRTGGLDTLSGWFSLVWQKRGDDWVIIRDHSS